MSRSRSLSYCSLSYSWRLIRFTRRRRRSGTAWGLEKAHTHTCMYMHTRTDQTCPSRQWERHTDAYMHAQTQLDTTQNRSELLFKYKYNWVSAHLNEWQLDQRRKLRKNKQTTELNSCTSLLMMFWSVWLSVKVISCWDAAHVPDEGWTDQNTGIE